MSRIPPNAAQKRCHPTRVAIVEAIRWVRPLSPPDLAAVLDDLDVRLASVRYHATVLVGEEVLTEIGRRPAGVSVEVVYALAYAR